MGNVENNSTIYMMDLLDKIGKIISQDPLFQYSNLTKYLQAHCKKRILSLNAEEHAAYEWQKKETQTLKKKIEVYIQAPTGWDIFRMLLDVSLAQLKNLLVLKYEEPVVHEIWGIYRVAAHGVDSIAYLPFCKEDIISVEAMPDFEPFFTDLEYFKPEELRKLKAKSSYRSDRSRFKFSPKKFCGNEPKQFICDLIDGCIKDKSNRAQPLNEKIK